MTPTFQSILGQPAALSTIQRAYTSNHLPHALLFAGPIGVGKSLTARALATLFLCQKPTDRAPWVSPCGKCDSCTLMSSATHPDYHRVYRQLIRLEKDTSKARDLPIAVIRDYLVAPANLKPTLNHGKVFVVEEADLMNPQAQNGLLKTLEEPPAQTLIILLTDQPNSLLPTIRSRCQLITFSPLDPELVRDQLIQQHQIDPATAARAADLSEGSLGQALRWIEDGTLSAATDLHAHLLTLTQGYSIPISLESWFKTAADAYAKHQLDHDPLASKDQATREGLTLYLRLAALFFRRQLSQTDNPDLLDRLCSAIEALTQTENLLDANVNIPLAFQQLSMALHRHLTTP
ncbi:MAG TPA: DNA polymerase III subunit delta' [Tepidisphaeraceae bacterium]|jgi:DNA polymerase-3 subunit delta'|nr:DNA polymerase III subunit delta' [Tepidisphaeraceae bacterium]